MSSDVSAGSGARPTIVGLDLLRLLAALLVAAYHFMFFSWVEPAGYAGIRDVAGDIQPMPLAVPFFWWGWIGVELFFVISGFVISMSAAGRSAGQFAIGRVSRLFPALLFFSMAALIVMTCSNLLPFDTALLRWLRTIILFPKGPWLDGVIWTLVVEIVFYGAIFVVLLMGRAHRLPMLARGALGVTSLYWLFTLLSYPVDLGIFGAMLREMASAYSAKVVLLTSGCYFLVGMFAHEMFERGYTHERAACLLAAVLGSLTAIWHVAADVAGVTQFGMSPMIPVIIWLSATLLCGLVVISERARPASAPYRQVARRLGLLTYPLYLMHNITGGWMLGQFYDLGAPLPIAALGSLLACLVVSYSFAAWIEPPVQRSLRQGLAVIFGPARSKV